MTSLIVASLLTAPMFLSSIPQSVSTTPAHRNGEEWWKSRHEKCVEITKKGGVDVVFLGDSITQGWEGDGKAVWQKEFSTLKAANFGFSGDRTEHVLWRLENGEIMGLDPKLIVIMIGTNNLGHGSSNESQTADGVKMIVSKLRKGLPNAKILLLGIFPRGATAEDVLRKKVADATQQFKGLDSDPSVTFLDIGYAFTRHNGTLRTKLMPDLLHLTPDGYEIWAKAIKPTMMDLLSND